MAISRVVELQLERSWCHWKANLNIYKFIFHKIWPILKYVCSSAHIVQSSVLAPIKAGNACSSAIEST
jgi:hypothetical protein